MLIDDPAALEQLADQLARNVAGHLSNASLGRLDANPEQVEQGLAKLVLTLIELLRRLMERQAVRRVSGGNLSEAEVERMGQTFMHLESRMQELKKAFGLQDHELNINLGPLGNLL